MAGYVWPRSRPHPLAMAGAFGAAIVRDLARASSENPARERRRWAVASRVSKALVVFRELDADHDAHECG